MELTSLESERKMSEVAIKAHQTSLSEALNGSMGQDMMDVLSGKKVVKLSFFQKLNYKINNFLNMFSREEYEQEYGI